MTVATPEPHPTLDLFEAPVVGWPDRPRYLMSFAYVDDSQVALCVEHGVDLIMDSGAFTTASSGKQMDHDGYLNWLVLNAPHITFALSYDVIGDHEASATNHAYALERVEGAVKMVPAWHLGSPMDELDRMCEENNLVCIGGAVPFARTPDVLYRVTSEAHRVAARYGTNLHGLGMTGNRILHGLPWYSVDSSAWLSAVRFPSLPLANHAGRIVPFEHGTYLDNLSRQLVAQYDGDPAVVATKGWSLKAVVGQAESGVRRAWVMEACARSYMYLEAAKNAYQPATPIKVYLSGNSGNPGGAIAPIARAFELGNPWLTTKEPVRWHTIPTPKESTPMKPTRYTISKEFAWSASHILGGLPEGHQCGRLHGHNYVAVVTLHGNHLDDHGFVVDYGELGFVKDLIDKVWDHRHLNDVAGFETVNPTAEAMARVLAEYVQTTLDRDYSVAVEVAISETPKTWATYRTEGARA